MRFLVTGGAGFIGSNLTRSLLDEGHEVVLLDNLSRRGVRANVEWLSEGPGRDRLQIVVADIRDREAVATCVDGVDTVFHLAAQVAVTTSVTDPRSDFEINALGAFNVLEAVRTMPKPASLVFTSTNKVYGGLEHLKVVESERRCRLSARPRGVSEREPLDFHSPYGCSKGTADQYVRDYARIYGLRTMVFRMSCIYGPRQFGNEDQGWVAHFMLRAARGEPVTLYGNGKQVRDLLFVGDLVRAFHLAARRLQESPGGVYNLGGGPKNTLSLLELIEELERLYDRPMRIEHGDMRPGDQPVYVSDIRLAKQELGWSPEVSVKEGLDRLSKWAAEALQILAENERRG